MYHNSIFDFIYTHQKSYDEENIQISDIVDIAFNYGLNDEHLNFHFIFVLSFLICFTFYVSLLLLFLIKEEKIVALGSRRITSKRIDCHRMPGC